MSQKGIEDVPEQVAVTITYKDDYGHEYTDVYPLDVLLIRMGTTSVGSGSPEKQRKEALKLLQAGTAAIKAISNELPDITAVLSGRDPDAERQEAHAARSAAHEARIAGLFRDPAEAVPQEAEAVPQGGDDPASTNPT